MDADEIAKAVANLPNIISMLSSAQKPDDDLDKTPIYNTAGWQMLRGRQEAPGGRRLFDPQLMVTLAEKMRD